MIQFWTQVVEGWEIICSPQITLSLHRWVFVITLLLYMPLSPGLGINLVAAEPNSQLQEASEAHKQAERLFKEGQFVQALALAKEAVTLREEILGPNHEDVAEDLTTLGMIHGTLIQLPQATTLLERALRIYQSSAVPSEQLIGKGLTNLATVRYAAGDFIGAIDLLEQSLEIRERVLSPSHPDVAVTLSHFAIALRGVSRLEQARDFVQRAITILRGTNPPRLVDLAIAVNVEGNILARLGKFEEARLRLEESLHLFEQASGPEHPDIAGALAQLAMLERKQRNFVAALPLLNQALRITERSVGKHNPEVAGILYEIGLVELALGRIVKAQGRFERSIAIQHATVGLTHPFTALSLIELAEIKSRGGERTVASELLHQALQIQKQSLGHEHTSVAQTLTRLGYLEAQSHDLSSAKSHFGRALQIRKKTLGPFHRDVATSLLNLGRVEHAMEHYGPARKLYERARLIIQNQQGLNPGLDDDALSRIWKQDMKGLQDYALLLATLAQTSQPSLEQQSAVTDGFIVTQQARGWLMQAAVANMLAQQTVERAIDRDLIKQVEELRRKRQALWTRLNQLYGLPEGQRSLLELTNAKNQLDDVQHRLTQANKQLKEKAPRYAELSQPETLGINDVHVLLKDHEALMSFYTLGDRVQIWLLRAGHSISYHQVKISRESLIKQVKKIRDSLVSRHQPYDVETASDLYQLLFAPIASSLDKVNHLILVPDDVLLPLPFAALVTHSTQKEFIRLDQRFRSNQSLTSEDLIAYAKLPWLVNSYPLTILPSTSALKFIRQDMANHEEQVEPFLGFGDPELRGTGNRRGGGMMSSRGMSLDIDALHTLNPLPGTRAELLTMAAILKVNPDNAVFLGSRATETEVRRLNDSGRLGQAKVLAFSTHGLLAGEIKGVTQPALVLTPPRLPSKTNDGLLSMEDILQLRLPHTDWVVLSACNTAGDDGSGESLSGLARAFFFAGAKALLVSQWSVDDEATKILMSEIFKRYGGVPSLPPARALREGILALLKKASNEPGFHFLAHPYAWAAFSLVGEGARKDIL